MSKSPQPRDEQQTTEYQPLVSPDSLAPIPLAETTTPEPAVSVVPGAVAPKKISTLGDFRLVAILGSGAMGTVYRGKHVRDGRDAAIKVLSKELASRSDFVARFLREAKLMAQLDHVNVLRCFDAGTSYGFHYLAMEYAGGGSVQSWLARLGKMELPDVVCVITGAARGLGYVHEQKLVHRDVKPDNLLFSSEGVVKLADLGLARQTDGAGIDLTATGTGIGTPLYAAPEQTRDAKHADGRSDMYSLGCVFYQLIAGRLPFDAKSLVELLIAKDRGDFAPLRQQRRGLPARVDAIVARMLARAPEQRYADCAALLADLAMLGTPPEVPTFFRQGTCEGSGGELR